VGSVPDRIHPVKRRTPTLCVAGQCSVPSARYRPRSARDEIWIAHMIGVGCSSRTRLRRFAQHRKQLNIR